MIGSVAIAVTTQRWGENLLLVSSLEKEMGTHSSILAWKILWMEKPDRLQSMGSQSQIRLSNFTFTFSIQLSVTCRPLCILLVSLAVTDGVIPYSSWTCQHYSQLLENCLFNHQLEQCIDSQSYRLTTYCLHNHVMYIQGPGCQKCFPIMTPTAATFPPPGDLHPRWYPNTMALPSCPCASIYPQMPCRCYNPEPVSVCQINGKTYWTGTVIQTNEIRPTLS